MVLCENALPLLFLPPVLRIPTGLCILDDLKYLSLVEIGTIFDNGAPSWSNDLFLTCTFEGIYRNFDIFLAELVIYEFELEK